MASTDYSAKSYSQEEWNSFVELFSGKFDVSLKGMGYQRDAEFLSAHKDPYMVICACMVFFSKPKAFLVTGRTKSGQGDGKGVNLKLLELLPTKEPSEDPGKQAAWRASAHGAWATVNVSSVRRIALMAFEKLPAEGHPLVRQFHVSRGGRPSTCPLPTEAESEVNETRRIFRETILHFRAEKGFWAGVNLPIAPVRR